MKMCENSQHCHAKDLRCRFHGLHLGCGSKRLQFRVRTLHHSQSFDWRYSLQRPLHRQTVRNHSRRRHSLEPFHLGWKPECCLQIPLGVSSSSSVHRIQNLSLNLAAVALEQVFSTLLRWEKNELVSKENKHCKGKHTFWFGWLLLFGCFLLSKLFIGVGTIV